MIKKRVFLIYNICYKKYFIMFCCIVFEYVIVINLNLFVLVVY